MCDYLWSQNILILFVNYKLVQFVFPLLMDELVVDTLNRPGIHGTQVKSSVRMKKTQESSKWLFLGNLIPEIESKAPN
jgi:hypothetical protein